MSTPLRPSSAAAAPSSGIAVSTADRERVVQELGTHFAFDRLSLDGYEERLERAYRAVTRQQLDELLRDLPSATGEELSAVPAPLLVPASEVAPRGLMSAFMGGTERSGSWIVPQHVKVWSTMGGVVLDMREARFAPGVTEIELFVLMGGVELIVPPGVRVETSSVAAVAGGIDNKAGDATALSPLNPVIRLSGLVILGGVETKTRLPGESEKERKIRLRREREARRKRER